MNDVIVILLMLTTMGIIYGFGWIIMLIVLAKRPTKKGKTK